MHQDDIVILECILCTIDAIDVVGLVVKRVVYEGVLQREVKRIAIVFQYLIIITRGHNYFLNTKRSEESKLSA